MQGKGPLRGDERKWYWSKGMKYNPRTGIYSWIDRIGRLYQRREGGDWVGARPLKIWRKK